jgi:hypothetical protein
MIVAIKRVLIVGIIMGVEIYGEFKHGRERIQQILGIRSNCQACGGTERFADKCVWSCMGLDFVF